MTLKILFIPVIAFAAMYASFSDARPQIEEVWLKAFDSDDSGSDDTDLQVSDSKNIPFRPTLRSSSGF